MAEALHSGQEADVGQGAGFTVRAPLSVAAEGVSWDDLIDEVRELRDEVHWLRHGWGVPDLMEITDISEEIVERVRDLGDRVGQHARMVMAGRQASSLDG